MKHILITGGTGLIGSALCQQLIKKHYKVTVLSRHLNTVSKKCNPQVRGITSLSEIMDDDTVDVMINLAGEPIADKRWSTNRKKQLEASRIDLTRELIQWMANKQIKPNCLISGSAIGWYGDGGDKILTEQSQHHDEYTHHLCDEWEKQALRAQHFGIRVCIIRTGLVLARQGGFIPKMLLPFKLGLGGQLGDGEQFMPWIHLIDIVNLIIFLVENSQANGVFNACSPRPISNKTFTAAFARQLHRVAFIPLPAWLLKSLLGEMSRLLLTGQNAIPEKARAIGFRFVYTNISLALADILSTKK
ncbi:hypothetical protein LCGC14_0618400 [marine sediment metagenome]|uniref:NAD-dependent epimerase/dehydratase domain-containing protein n=1 Tax=marine sediment metagenome TaxID=412755 RepID=A0A0F9RPX0_9ZZZZ|nr:TIGR01777 family protein [Methylophaga sp.]